MASFDALLLSQSIAIAAEAEGWGICYMGTTLHVMPELQKFFNLPPTVAPVTSMVVGFPAEAPAARKRLPLEAYIHEERYHEYTNEALDKIYEFRNGDLQRRYGTNAELMQEFKDHGIENLAQFYTSELKYFPPHMREYGEKIREFLKANDFDFRG